MSQQDQGGRPNLDSLDAIIERINELLADTWRGKQDRPDVYGKVEPPDDYQFSCYNPHEALLEVWEAMDRLGPAPPACPGLEYRTFDCVAAEKGCKEAQDRLNTFWEAWKNGLREALRHCQSLQKAGESGSSKSKPTKQRKKPGPKRTPEKIKEDQAIADAWKRAKESGISRPAFVEDAEGLKTVKDLEDVQGRLRKDKTRSKG